MLSMTASGLPSPANTLNFTTPSWPCRTCWAGELLTKKVKSARAEVETARNRAAPAKLVSVIFFLLHLELRRWRGKRIRKERRHKCRRGTPGGARHKKKKTTEASRSAGRIEDRLLRLCGRATR